MLNAWAKYMCYALSLLIYFSTCVWANSYHPYTVLTQTELWLLCNVCVEIKGTLTVTIFCKLIHFICHWCFNKIKHHSGETLLLTVIRMTFFQIILLLSCHHMFSMPVKIETLYTYNFYFKSIAGPCYRRAILKTTDNLIQGWKFTGGF